MSSGTSPRDLIERLEQECIGLLSRLKGLVETVPVQLLYETAFDLPTSVGENIVRSAATLEQAFGGLTTNLWDDPHEWTLPETLSSTERITEYLGEVDDARTRAFASLVDDSALEKYIAMPSGEQASIQALLVNALKTAKNFEQRAAETHEILFADRPPRFII
ncbi:MAG TPA: hypothetical protein VLA93_06895 [Pyrinomonadaceae bacterium]|nr:hypothetical protein [Pyrinomonadaceae bacterium]